MKDCQAIVRVLEDEGVDTIFGIPGIHTLSLYDEISKHKSLRHILVKHEQSAVFSALGYALTTNRTGVALVVPGPGVLNTVSAVAEAYYQHKPIVLLAADIPFATQGRGMFHEVDSMRILTPITKARYAPRSATAMVEALREAFYQARAGCPGPVYVAIPQDFLEGRETVTTLAQKKTYAPPAVLPGDVQKVAALLCESSAPFLWAGDGVVFAEAMDELRVLAEILELPVITAMGARGCMPEDHPLNAGVPGFGFPFAIFKNADLSVAIGLRFTVLDTYLRFIPAPKQLVRIGVSADDDRPEDRSGYQITHEITAHPKQFLAALVAEVKAGMRNKSRRNPIAELLSEHTRANMTAQPAALYPDGALVKPQHFMRALTAALQGKDFSYITESVWAFMRGISPRIQKPLRFGIVQSFGCLGFSLPAAIGAAVAHPEHTVIGISGDGGFLFSCQEIATAADNSLANLVYFIITNNQFRNFYYTQQELFAGRHIATSWKPIDFARVAEGFGAQGYTIASPAEVEPTIKRVLSEPGPAIVSVITESVPTPEEEMFVQKIKNTGAIIGE
jgi:acetolactate synthase-1/2/3 large subunit